MPVAQKSDFGWIIRRTIVDQDGDVVDISAATTRQLRLKKPDNTVVTKSAAFTTSGTDGKIEYGFLSGDLDQHGAWEFQFVLSSGSFQLSTPMEKMNVGRLLS